METLRTDLDRKYREYEAAVGSLNFEPKVAAARAAVQETAALKLESVADVAAAREKIARLNETRLDLERSIATVQDVRTRFSTDLGEQRGLLDRINQLRDADVQAVSAALKLPSLSWTAAAQALFGPVWIARVDKTMNIVHLVRKYMPPRKKQDTVVEFQRARGKDIAFPREQTLPSFLVKHIQISGTTGGRGKNVAAIDFSGAAYDITSDQALLGRPTKFAVTGTQGQIVIGMDGVFNHTAEIPDDTIAFTLTGVPAADLRLPDSAYLPSFDRARMNARGIFRVTGDQIDCSIDVAVDGVAYSTAPAQQNAEVQQLVAALWKGISTIELTGTLAGPADALHLAIHSNLDTIMADRLKSLFGSKVQELTARVRAEIDARTDEKKQELLADFARRKDALLKEYTERQKELETVLASVTSGITDKQNEINRQAEQEKKKAENAVKQQAEEKLKGLFGR
jgi:uncharacterized protein (TIGR03545 family)